jgi:thiamine-monophosphate kinase
MDISDGLYCDTDKLLDANGMGFEELRQIGPEIGESGEEYEMLIGFDPRNEKELQKICERTDTPLSIFARVTGGDSRYPCKSHHFD